jgi:taurine dioxygenase
MALADTKLSVKKLSDALGAEVRGIDLSKPLPDDVFQEICDAWLEHLLLVFPDQHLSNEAHIEFSRRFGTLEIHPSHKYNVKENPELLLLTNRKDADGNYVSIRDGGSIWHSDLSYMAEPSRCSLLYAIDVPADGGDTEWANMYLAYDALPEHLKSRIARLRAMNHFIMSENPRFQPPRDMPPEQRIGTQWAEKTPEEKARTPGAVHPIVRTHPTTGRKALFITRRFTTHIVDMDPDEGEALLLDLFDYAERREHIYHHRWSVNHLLLWDNRYTAHLACGGVPDNQIRTMQRTTVKGEIPV